MDAQQIKEHILDNNLLPSILEELECQHIRYHNSGYWTCGNPPPSDNQYAITVYKDNLKVINYTKEMPTPSDLITLIEYIKDLNFFHALKWLHNFLGLDFYSNPDENLPESLRITKMLLSLKNKNNQDEEDATPIKPIPESILSYYISCVNDFWLRDHVDYITQREWELGYDNETNRITIPIRSEIGDLCGIKGRLFKESLSEDDLKYLYIDRPCPREKILYGLHKTYPYIKEQGIVYVGEAEKFCHQLWAYGYKNCVATGGERVSKTQIDKLSRLGVKVCLCFDKDVSREKIKSITSLFIPGIEVYVMWDDNNILEGHESPSDDKGKFEFLMQNCIHKITNNQTNQTQKVEENKVD